MAEQSSAENSRVQLTADVVCKVSRPPLRWCSGGPGLGSPGSYQPRPPCPLRTAEQHDVTRFRTPAGQWEPNIITLQHQAGSWGDGFLKEESIISPRPRSKQTHISFIPSRLLDCFAKSTGSCCIVTLRLSQCSSTVLHNTGKCCSSVASLG